MTPLTFLTSCPTCKQILLFDGDLVGKTVKCSKCDANFVCRVHTGPIPWVQSILSAAPRGGFRKQISRVLFTYGLSIPLDWQEPFIEHSGKRMKPGESVSVDVVFRGVRYSARMNYFIKKTGTPALHLIWTRDNPICGVLENALPEEFSHYVTKGEKSVLPGRFVHLQTSQRTREYELLASETTRPEQTSSFSSLSETLKGVNTQQTLRELLR